MTEDARQRQLRLFDPAATSRVVGCAVVPQELEQIAGRLPREIRLGTSSWSFPGWQGLVYDRAADKTHLARHGLAAYGRHGLLRAVGIDRTFYAPIPSSTFAAYSAAVPRDFRFLVKAAGQCTTPRLRESGARNELFLHAGFATDEVVGPFVEGLADKAGPLVFQFPPQGAEWTAEPARFAEALGRFLGELPRGPWYTVELRDGELLCEDYLAALRGADVRHCLAVHPRMPSFAEQWRRVRGDADGPLVVRWMLHAGLGYEEARRRYEPFDRLVDEDPRSRASIAELCIEQARKGREIVVIANNKAEGSAPRTVFRLAGAIGERMK